LQYLYHYLIPIGRGYRSLLLLSALLAIHRGYHETKYRAIAGCGLNPDAFLISFDNALADRKSDARSLVSVAV
jgi:hypothetical protein